LAQNCRVVATITHIDVIDVTATVCGIGPLFRRAAIPKLCGDWAVAELLVILVSFNGSPYNIVLVLIILKVVG